MRVSRKCELSHPVPFVHVATSTLNVLLSLTCVVATFHLSGFSEEFISSKRFLTSPQSIHPPSNPHCTLCTRCPHVCLPLSNYKFPERQRGRETVNKTKRQPFKWKKIFANNTFDKELISKIYKEII